MCPRRKESNPPGVTDGVSRYLLNWRQQCHRDTCRHTTVGWLKVPWRLEQDPDTIRRQDAQAMGNHRAQEGVHQARRNSESRNGSNVRTEGTARDRRLGREYGQRTGAYDALRTPIAAIRHRLRLGVKSMLQHSQLHPHLMQAAERESRPAPGIFKMGSSCGSKHSVGTGRESVARAGERKTAPPAGLSVIDPFE